MGVGILFFNLKIVTFVSSPCKILTFQQSDKEFLQAMNYFWKGEGGLFTIVLRLTAWVCFLPVITLQNIWLKRENTLGCLFNQKNVDERQLVFYEC